MSDYHISIECSKEKHFRFLMLESKKIKARSISLSGDLAPHSGSILVSEVFLEILWGE